MLQIQDIREEGNDKVVELAKRPDWLHVVQAGLSLLYACMPASKLSFHLRL